MARPARENTKFDRLVPAGRTTSVLRRRQIGGPSSISIIETVLYTDHDRGWNGHVLKVIVCWRVRASCDGPSGINECKEKKLEKKKERSTARGTNGGECPRKSNWRNPDGNSLTAPRDRTAEGGLAGRTQQTFHIRSLSAPPNLALCPCSGWFLFLCSPTCWKRARIKKNRC